LNLSECGLYNTDVEFALTIAADLASCRIAPAQDVLVYMYGSFSICYSIWLFGSIRMVVTPVLTTAAGSLDVEGWVLALLLFF